jgi:hypothetical protein
MNYTQLASAISQYTENFETDFVANIPVFVEQAEQRIYNTVQLPELRRNQIGNTTANNKYLSLPPDYLSTYSLAVILSGTTGPQEFLLNKDVNYIRQCYPNPNDLGVPKFYAQFDANTFILGPTPDATYQVELHYYYYPESIVTNGTSWLGDHFDSVLLYGSLVEAYTFMKGEQDLLNLYNTKFGEALTLLKRLGDGLDRQDAYRSGQVRVQVN